MKYISGSRIQMNRAQMNALAALYAQAEQQSGESVDAVTLYELLPVGDIGVRFETDTVTVSWAITGSGRWR